MKLKPEAKTFRYAEKYKKIPDHTHASYFRYDGFSLMPSAKNPQIVVPEIARSDAKSAYPGSCEKAFREARTNGFSLNLTRMRFIGIVAKTKRI